MDRREFLQAALLTAGAVKLAACTSAACDPAAGDCAARYPFFVEHGACTACGKCIDQCGKKAFKLPGGANVITIDFTRCTRCGSCFLACEGQGYLAVTMTIAGDGLPFYDIDQELCQKCLSCHKVCTAVPDKAIVQSNLDRTRIDQVKCSHCGECVELSFCPFGAIHENRPG
jgi:ferredoxin